jgi:hypothetical protein
MKAAQIDRPSPPSGPKNNQVAIPPKSPMLTDSAVMRSILPSRTVDFFILADARHCTPAFQVSDICAPSRATLCLKLFCPADAQHARSAAA